MGLLFMILATLIVGGLGLFMTFLGGWGVYARYTVGHSSDISPSYPIATLALVMGLGFLVMSAFFIPTYQAEERDRVRCEELGGTWDGDYCWSGKIDLGN